MKKKHFIGLSTLLLVLLLGCFSPSYALTENGFKNLIYNFMVNDQQYTDTQAKTFVNGAYESFEGYYNYMTDEYLWFVCKDGTTIDFWVQPASNYGTTRTNKNTSFTDGGNRNFYPISYNGIYFQLGYSNGNPYFTTNSGTTMNRVRRITNIYYTEQDIYNTTYNTIIEQAPSNSPSWFTSSGAYDINFDYVYNPVFQNVTVQDLLAQDVQMKAITYSDIYYDNDYLCIFGDFDQLDHVYLAYYKYNRYSGQWEPYQWVSPYTNYEKEDNQIRLYFNGNYVANTIICLGFIPKTEDFYAQYAWFYLTGKNTSTSGGIVVPTSYSGDNDVQQQINDNNLQEIKDTLTDDSEVDNMLAEFGSGDINTMASKFGLPSIPNPFSQFIETIFYGITDVLTLDGDVSLDFGFQGQHMYLKSSDFVTPTNAITVFISSFLTFVYVYYMIELGYRTLINIREFNLDKTGIGSHYGQAGDGLQADGSWRLL